eukprot:6823243-Lingulodinium_polyedra.AAC.1
MQPYSRVLSAANSVLSRGRPRNSRAKARPDSENRGHFPGSPGARARRGCFICPRGHAGGRGRGCRRLCR